MAQNILRQAHVRFEAGDVPQLDVMRAKVEVGRATNRLTAAKNDLSVAKTALNALLARPLQTPFAIADSLNLSTLGDRSRPIDRSSPKSNGPILAGIALQLKAVQSKQAAATVAYLPDLNVGLARQQRHGGERGGFLAFAFRPRSAAVGLFSPARANGPKPKPKQLKLQPNGTRCTIKSSWKHNRPIWISIPPQDKWPCSKTIFYPEAERAFAVASRSYDEGKLTYLELLEAQRTWIEPQIEYAQVLFKYRAATAYVGMGHC